MPRPFHRWPGLIAAAFLVVLAVSGTMLSTFPAAETLTRPRGDENTISVAALAGRIVTAIPQVEQIQRSPSGTVTATWREGLAQKFAVVDVNSGKAVADGTPSAALLWLKELHRSLFLGDGGRIVTGAASIALIALALTGMTLVARRTGGWRRFFSPLKGSLSGRIHVDIARTAIVGLVLSALTALWMTLAMFGFVPSGDQPPPAFPAAVSGKTDFPPENMDVLRVTTVRHLRELTFPRAGDTRDVYTLTTDGGIGYVDQGNGALLAWRTLGSWARVYEIIYMLHTGEGASLLGLVLGLMALGLPVMAATGIVVWANGRRMRPRIGANTPATQAETIILVGSESGSTWGFAATLHAALVATNRNVHTSPLADFVPVRYGAAKQIIVLAATYGEGDAPTTAGNFIDRLAAIEKPPAPPLAILGFGDRSFPNYCAYAERIARLAEEKGWNSLLPMETVDRQSAQDFRRWGRILGAAVHIPLELNHHTVLPATTELVLVSRRDYGGAADRPSAILRFALPKASVVQRLSRRSFTHFSAGDLLGIIPEGSEVPRLYSLSSSSRDGFVDICVSYHRNGLCSGQLVKLKPGRSVRAFLRRNSGFRPSGGRKPLILIGAGTGIGPLAGFIRGNRTRRPVHLYFGARHPDSDLLYDEELSHWQRDGRLTGLSTAFSRTETPIYVQDALRCDTALVTQYVAQGAQILVCGGREMARDVAEAITDLLAPMGLSPALLKAEGRYAEDIY